jgi:hypothetical protein
LLVLLCSQSPQFVRTGYYHEGVLLLADARAMEGDTLIAITVQPTLPVRLSSETDLFRSSLID